MKPCHTAKLANSRVLSSNNYYLLYIHDLSSIAFSFCCSCVIVEDCVVMWTGIPRNEWEHPSLIIEYFADVDLQLYILIQTWIFVNMTAIRCIVHPFVRSIVNSLSSLKITIPDWFRIISAVQRGDGQRRTQPGVHPPIGGTIITAQHNMLYNSPLRWMCDGNVWFIIRIAFYSLNQRLQVPWWGRWIGYLCSCAQELRKSIHPAVALQYMHQSNMPWQCVTWFVIPHWIHQYHAIKADVRLSSNSPMMCLSMHHQLRFNAFLTFDVSTQLLIFPLSFSSSCGMLTWDACRWVYIREPTAPCRRCVYLSLLWRQCYRRRLNVVRALPPQQIHLPRQPDIHTCDMNDSK